MFGTTCNRPRPSGRFGRTIPLKKPSRPAAHTNLGGERRAGPAESLNREFRRRTIDLIRVLAKLSQVDRRVSRASKLHWPRLA